jgi:hypothetical protein
MNLDGRLEGSSPFEHGANGTIFFFGQMNSLFHGRLLDADPRKHVAQANGGKYLRRPLGLVRFDKNLIACQFLVMFLAKHGDDIKGGAASQRYGDQFDGLGAGCARGVVQNDVMAATRFRDELTLGFQSLCESYFCCDHWKLPLPLPCLVVMERCVLAPLWEEMQNLRICYRKF